MFHCQDCAISFPSAALLSNHKQKFCVASRVDRRTRALLEGDGGGNFSTPGGLGNNGHPSFAGSNAPWGDAAQPSFAHPQVAPMGSSALYGRRSSLSQGNGGYLSGIRRDDGPRSYSAEPGPTSGFLQPGNAQLGGNFPASGSGMFSSPAPYIPQSGGGGGHMLPPPGPRIMQDTDMYRIIEQQQQQLNMLQSMLMAQGNSGLGGGGAALAPIRQPATSQQGVVGMVNGASVIEGRYGLRIFAAEGLLAFHAIADHTPVTIAIRQFYCRRRVGNYMPELEQRDEWEFTTRRHVSAKRRDGYVNFGRAEYIFNVITANEIVLVIELLAKNRLIAWTEVLMNSLGDKVRRLRYPPVDIAGALRDISLRATTATIGVEVFKARWDMMGFDGRDDEEEEENEAPPPKKKPPSEKSMSVPPPVEESVEFYLDALSGVPFNILFTRAAVHVSTEVNIIGDPVTISYQTPESPAQEPQFASNCTCRLTDSSCVVVVIESIESKKKTRVLLGHCVIPVRIGSASGNFIARVRRGEPNTQQLIPYDENINDYLPCMFLKYRLNSDDKRKKYTERQPILDYERVLEDERHRKSMFSAAQNGVGDLDEVKRLFDSPISRDVFDTSFLSPYNEGRGLSVYVESLRKMARDDFAIYKVTCEVPRSNERLQWTRKNDMSSDYACPKFKDPPFIFRGVKFDPLAFVLFRIYECRNPRVGKSNTFDPIGWSVAKLFLPPDALRHGRFLLPIYEGVPSDSILDDLTKKQMEQVLGEALAKMFGKLTYLNHSMLVVGFGDPSRSAENTGGHVTKPLAKPAQVPENSRAKFPIEREGLSGKLIQNFVHEGTPEQLLETLNRKMQLIPGVTH